MRARCRTCRRLDADFATLMVRIDANKLAKPIEPGELWMKGCTPAEHVQSVVAWDDWKRTKKELDEAFDVEIERICRHNETAHLGEPYVDPCARPGKP